VPTHTLQNLALTMSVRMQFKPVFLGTADPNSGLAQLKRAADSQKVGGHPALVSISIISTPR